MNRRTKIIIALLLSLQGLTLFGAINPEVTEGVLDLRQIEQGDEFSVRMNGEWEFYFDRFLDPSVWNDSVNPDCYGEVPSYWTSYRINGHKLPGFGFATYRVVILLPKGYRDRMGFDMPVFDTSYELYINGVRLAKNGTPAKHRNESVPEYNPLFFSYIPQKDTLNLQINVSNFEHRRGGFWLPVRVGSFHRIQSDFANQWFSSIAVSGILLASFIFFFIFFLFDRKNPRLLMFATLALGLALRPLFSSPYLITLANIRHWDMIIRAEYLLLFYMVTTGAWLVYYIYPRKWFRSISLANDVIFLAGLILIISTPVYIFANTIFFIQGMVLLIIGYATVFSLKGMLKRNWIDFIYFVAIAAMTIGIVADIILANGFEQTQKVYMLSTLMIFFVILQATVLIRDWVRTGDEKVKLSFELEELNRTLESRVEERTRELLEKSDELNSRNEQVARQNKRLSETIDLKNKIFSVISHDLRSPVVNILYSLNMLRDEENREKASALAGSCIQYSQMVISLLENMLVWGRGQEEMIRFSPSENDLADIILTNMSILKEGADRKGITLHFTQVGRSKGWFDRDLLDIVVRNLLSNAIKYTHHGGRVTIHLREREENHEGLIIKICDNGIGISKERQNKLFSGGFIETTPGTDSEKGTGIGLKLVNELVTISKGSISVDSTPGEGSCFTIILPGKSVPRKRK